MKKRKQLQCKQLQLSVILLLGIGLTGLHAQESINTTGGNASGNEGSVSFSLGQVMYQTHTSTDGSVMEGVQQPYEISIITAIEETHGINLTVSAYPNPANDKLTLEVKNIELSTLQFLLYDIHGKLLQNKKIVSNQTSILMSNLPPGSYFVKVTQNNYEVKTFKIFKN